MKDDFDTYVVRIKDQRLIAVQTLDGHDAETDAWEVILAACARVLDERALSGLPDFVLGGTSYEWEGTSENELPF